MAVPPNPRIYMADDWSWDSVGGPFNIGTGWQTFYTGWDGHGAFGQIGYGTGAGRGWGFGGEPSSGSFGWTIIDLDTRIAITNATMGSCIGYNHKNVANVSIMEFAESYGGASHVQIWSDSSQHIVAKNGNGTVLGTSDLTLELSAADGTGPTDHIEAIVTVHNSLGTVQVWVNDILWLDLTGKDTQNGGTGVIGHVHWYVHGGRGIAECFVHDGSARLGSQWRVGYVPVGSDGTYSNGTAVGAATFLQAVDDAAGVSEAEDTSYGVLDATSLPKKTSFQSGSVPVTWLQIRDVFPQIVIKKSDGGTNTGKTGLKSGSTEVYTTSTYAVSDTWITRRLAFRTNPDTGTPLWTLVTAQASEVIIDRET